LIAASDGGVVVVGVVALVGAGPPVEGRLVDGVVGAGAGEVPDGEGSDGKNGRHRARAADARARSAVMAAWALATRFWT